MSYMEDSMMVDFDDVKASLDDNGRVMGKSKKKKKKKKKKKNGALVAKLSRPMLGYQVSMSNIW